MAELTGTAAGVRKRATQLLVSGAVIAVAMFAPAGRIDWWQAWAFLGIFFGTIAFNAVFILRRDPELIAERAETKKNTKGWDKTMTAAITVMTLLALVVAGLDVRFGWSSVPLAVSVSGLVLVVVGNALVSWGMAANRFFARTVRIQQDRGQTVCSAGPYRFVRHPGYAGMIVYGLAMAPGLGSWWALVPAVLAAVAFVVRTLLEDHMLQTELPGYSDYTTRVRYRLVPGIW
ncbi:MAG TPA: isoprenylcysteine carboxylmethyltransferase family protein [Dissulfurispiraceae bacterium]|nr:isoprenylcysteine carboxylmethyltransferase family protein [Dissulfurispiraceae bacterium]